MDEIFRYKRLRWMKGEIQRDLDLEITTQVDQIKGETKEFFKEKKSNAIGEGTDLDFLKKKSPTYGAKSLMRSRASIRGDTHTRTVIFSRNAEKGVSWQRLDTHCMRKDQRRKSLSEI